MAIEQLDKVILIEKDVEYYLLLKADLLRRSEQFEKLINEFENKTFPENIRFGTYSREESNKIIAFQVEIAKNSDSDCYTVADALKNNT